MGTERIEKRGAKEMRTVRLIALCLVIVFCGCSQARNGGSSETWVEIARFQGEADEWTKTFTVLPNHVRVSWETRPAAGGESKFKLDLVKAHYPYTVTEPVVEQGGPAQGSKTIQLNGKLYFVVTAEQPWVVWAEVPD